MERPTTDWSTTCQCPSWISWIRRPSRKSCRNFTATTMEPLIQRQSSSSSRSAKYRVYTSICSVQLSTTESYCMWLGKSLRPPVKGLFSAWKASVFYFNLSPYTSISQLSISVLCVFENVRPPCLLSQKVSQRLTEYGVHFHRVLPEKRSQTGIMLGVYSKGVLIFEVLNGNRTPVLRFPWRETKKISFTVCICLFVIRNKNLCQCTANPVY